MLRILVPNLWLGMPVALLCKAGRKTSLMVARRRKVIFIILAPPRDALRPTTQSVATGIPKQELGNESA